MDYVGVGTEMHEKKIVLSQNLVSIKPEHVSGRAMVFLMLALTEILT